MIIIHCDRYYIQANSGILKKCSVHIMRESGMGGNTVTVIFTTTLLLCLALGQCTEC